MKLGSLLSSVVMAVTWLPFRNSSYHSSLKATWWLNEGVGIIVKMLPQLQYFTEHKTVKNNIVFISSDHWMKMVITLVLTDYPYR